MLEIENEKTDTIEIRRGVRQGCILSPLIFNLYSEYIFREALDEIDEGILLNGERINNIRYADDTVIFADSIDGLQHLMSNLEDCSECYGLDMNISKTKLMIISKNNIQNCHITIKGKYLERVKRYTYLGTNINDQWDHSQEIKNRIERARAVYNKMAKLFTSHYLNINTKLRLLRCYVFSVLFYGVESWTLTETTSKKLEAFELWLYRRILRVSWTEKVTNSEILRRMNKEKEVLYTVKSRKLQYLGHIMRNECRYKLLQNILQGKVCGKRGVGRRRTSWLKNLRVWYSQTTTELFRAADNKIRIAQMIANVRTGQAP